MAGDRCVKANDEPAISKNQINCRKIFPHGSLANESISGTGDKSAISRHFLYVELGFTHDKRVPVTTAWRVLKLRMKDRPLSMESNYENTE